MKTLETIGSLNNYKIKFKKEAVFTADIDGTDIEDATEALKTYYAAGHIDIDWVEEEDQPITEILSIRKIS